MLSALTEHENLCVCCWRQSSLPKCLAYQKGRTILKCQSTRVHPFSWDVRQESMEWGLRRQLMFSTSPQFHSALILQPDQKWSCASFLLPSLPLSFSSCPFLLSCEEFAASKDEGDSAMRWFTEMSWLLHGGLCQVYVSLHFALANKASIWTNGPNLAWGQRDDDHRPSLSSR